MWALVDTAAGLCFVDGHESIQITVSAQCLCGCDWTRRYRADAGLETLHPSIYQIASHPISWWSLTNDVQSAGLDVTGRSCIQAAGQCHLPVCSDRNTSVWHQVSVLSALLWLVVGAWCGTPTSALVSAYFLLYSTVSTLKGITRYVSQVRETLGMPHSSWRLFYYWHLELLSVGTINRTHFNYSYHLLLRTISMDNSIACRDWMWGMWGEICLGLMWNTAHIVLWVNCLPFYGNE